MAGMLRRIAMRVPRLRQLLEENAALRAELARYRTLYPPGHFYSPLPDRTELREACRRAEADLGVDPPAIALNEERQKALLSELGRFHADAPFTDAPTEGLRYHYDNEFYAHADGIVLYAMLRHLTPRRVIEVGSGYSSAVILDTNQLFLRGQVRTTFIDPHAERLKSLLRDADRANVQVIEARVQDVAPAQFDELGPGDMLVVDSSHVAKAGSDLNHLMFEVLPRLAVGVHVHFHDVFFPFEYPLGWGEDGVAWNEAYLLRAFLQFNPAFSITWFTSMMLRRHRDLMALHLPVALKSERDHPTLKDTPGSSLWLTRTA